MKFTTKPSVVALVLAGMLASGSVWAAVQSTAPTLTIKGEKPYITRVGPAGLLKEGATLTIPKGNTNLYVFGDTDTDTDASIATVEWFIVEVGATALPAAGQGTMGSGADASFTIPSDGSAFNKQVGFRITPTTSIGDPDTNNAIEVLDVSKLGGQEPDGTDGGDKGIDNPELVDGGEDGKVDAGSDKYIVSIINEVGEDILAAGVNPKVNTVYTAEIRGATNGVDYTEAFKKSIKWKLAENGGTATVVEPVAGSENKQFKTQITNLEAQVQHSIHMSEQGLEILVEFDNDPNAAANQ